MYELRDENMGSLDKKASKLSDTLRIVATYAVLLFHYFCQKKQSRTVDAVIKTSSGIVYNVIITRCYTMDIARTPLGVANMFS